MNELMNSDGRTHGFSFLTNYIGVLMLIAEYPNIRMRDLATRVSITERAVQRIVDDLTTYRYLIITKNGRRNQYAVRADRPLGVSDQQHRTVGDLIQFLNG